MIRAAALCAALALGGCAGVPVGGHSYVYVGVGVVHIEKQADATGIHATTLGLTAGCGQITVGARPRSASCFRNMAASRSSIALAA